MMTHVLLFWPFTISTNSMVHVIISIVSRNTCKLFGQIIIIIIIIIGIYIAPFPFIKCSKALHIVIV